MDKYVKIEISSTEISKQRNLNLFTYETEKYVKNGISSTEISRINKNTDN